jgi:hypothetical protein
VNVLQIKLAEFARGNELIYSTGGRLPGNLAKKMIS